MMIAVEDIFPKKFLKKGLSLPIYEGSVGRDHLTLTLRETRHLEPAFLSRTLVTFLNLVASLDEPSQILLQRLMTDVAGGRECKYVELLGRSLIFFPDPHGEPAHDVYLDIGRSKRKIKSKARSKNKAKSGNVAAPAKTAVK
jgi:hypothetical protein